MHCDGFAFEQGLVTRDLTSTSLTCLFGYSVSSIRVAERSGAQVKSNRAALEKLFHRIQRTSIVFVVEGDGLAKPRTTRNSRSSSHAGSDGLPRSWTF